MSDWRAAGTAPMVALVLRAGSLIAVLCCVLAAGTATAASGPAVAPGDQDAAVRALGVTAFRAAPRGTPARTVAALRRAMPGQVVRRAATLRQARVAGTLYVLERASARNGLALAIPLGRAAILVRGVPGTQPVVKVVPRPADRIEIGTALVIEGPQSGGSRPGRGR